MLFLKKFLKIEKNFLEVFPIWWLVSLFTLIFLDLLTKKLITDHLNFFLTPLQIENIKGYEPNALVNGITYIPILGENGEYIKLRLVFNDRFIFGLGPTVPTLGIFLTLFAIIFLFIYRWKHNDLGNLIAWLFIFSGAIGNFIDKLFIKSVETREWVFSLGSKKGHVSGVVDFVECIWFGWEEFSNIPILSFLAWDTWPTFNLADSLIVVGIILLFITITWQEYQHQKNE